MYKPYYMFTYLVALALTCSTALSADLKTGLNIYNTSSLDTLSVSIDPSRYHNLIVKSRIIKTDDPDRLKIPNSDVYTQFKSDGVYQLQLPVDELMIRPRGHYIVVLDAYVNGIMSTEPPLQISKSVYVKITDNGGYRIGVKQFAVETQDTLVNTYSHFSDYFNGQGLDSNNIFTTPEPAPEPGPKPAPEPAPEPDPPEEDPLFPIWDCWANGNCDEDEEDPDPEPEPEDTGETTGETGDTSDGEPHGGGPIDSGPMW